MDIRQTLSGAWNLEPFTNYFMEHKCPACFPAPSKITLKSTSLLSRSTTPPHWWPCTLQMCRGITWSPFSAAWMGKELSTTSTVTASWAGSSSHSTLGSSPCPHQALRLSQIRGFYLFKTSSQHFFSARKRHMEIIVNLFLFIVRKPMEHVSYNGMWIHIFLLLM